MSSSLNVNNQTVVHKESGGIVVAASDVCYTPTPGGPVAVPYTNVADSKEIENGSQTVLVDGHPIMLKDSYFAKSTGDEAGSLGGVASGVTGGKAKFVNHSFDVSVEGRNVCRRLDPMVSNIGSVGNTPPVAEMQPPRDPANMEEILAEEWHLLVLALGYKQPGWIKARWVEPQLQTGHRFTGPESLVYEGVPGDGGYCYGNVSEGEYLLKLEEMNRKKRALKR
ncbi:MAG: DUF4150 domain-containing protein [Candidatus Manganitrophaceae bacterium]